MCQRNQAWRRFFENPVSVSYRRRGVNDSVLLTKEPFRWLG